MLAMMADRVGKVVGVRCVRRSFLESYTGEVQPRKKKSKAYLSKFYTETAKKQKAVESGFEGPACRCSLYPTTDDASIFGRTR